MDAQLVPLAVFGGAWLLLVFLAFADVSAMIAHVAILGATIWAFDGWGTRALVFVAANATGIGVGLALRALVNRPAPAPPDREPPPGP